MTRTVDKTLVLGENMARKRRYRMGFKTYVMVHGMHDKEVILMTPAGESE